MPRIFRKPTPRFLPPDPYFPHAWHLRNTGQFRALRGIDANVLGPWSANITGAGVSIAIVDDGVEIGHPDLAANAFPLDPNPASSLHFDFVENITDPNPTGDDIHGTAVAGLACAVSNSLGSLGVAFGASLAALRLTGEEIDDDLTAAALGWKNHLIDIYNNSWGPADDSQTLEGHGPAGTAALEAAALFGRGGLGNIII